MILLCRIEHAVVLFGSCSVGVSLPLASGAEVLASSYVGPGRREHPACLVKHLLMQHADGTSRADEW